MTTSLPPDAADTSIAPDPPAAVPFLGARRSQALGSLLVLLAMVAVAFAAVRRRGA